VQARTLCRLIVRCVGTATLAAAACAESGSFEKASLRIFAFPTAVEPGGEATIVVEVDVGQCNSADACTVCVGVPAVDGSGTLYPPPGLAVATGTAISLPSAEDALRGITYVAPRHEGSEVVSAACYAGRVDCTQPLGIERLLATTTVRLTIRKPGVVTDAALPPADAMPPPPLNDAGPGPRDAAPTPVDSGPPSPVNDP